MDNNPFRSHNANAFSSPMAGHSQYPQSNAMPVQTTNGFNPALLASQPPSFQTSAPTGYQSYQQQPQNNSFQPYQQPQQQSFYGGQPASQSSYQSYPQQQQPFQQQQQQQPFQSYQQPQFHQQQQQQQQPFYWQAPQQQQAQPYDPSSVFIPPDFGMSANPPSQQAQHRSQHPTVDADTYLRGNQVRKVECPVCHKTIEGDNIALNHHVNEHLEYDM